MEDCLMQVTNPVIGVDVSKDTLACSFLESSNDTVVLNDEPHIFRLLEDLSPGTAVAMESTGRYHLLLARLAFQAGMRVYVLNAQDVFFYAKALGTRGKTDRTDAQVIARYATEHQHKLHLWCPGTLCQRRIEELIRRRAGVTTHRAALQQLLGDQDALQTELHEIRLQFARLLDEIDRQIEHELQADPELRTGSALLQTITGIGPVGSAMLAALLTRIPFANADALVAYSGLDPRPNDSGRKQGIRRLSKRGPPELRRQMYLAGFSAARSKALKPLYLSIRARGFAPTQAIVILGRKLLRAAWAVWKSRQPFDPALLGSPKACART
jgi:transposase